MSDLRSGGKEERFPDAIAPRQEQPEITSGRGRKRRRPPADPPPFVAEFPRIPSSHFPESNVPNVRWPVYSPMIFTRARLRRRPSNSP